MMTGVLCEAVSVDIKELRARVWSALRFAEVSASFRGFAAAKSPERMNTAMYKRSPTQPALS
jgi:hypothetical protein